RFERSRSAQADGDANAGGGETGAGNGKNRLFRIDRGNPASGRRAGGETAPHLVRSNHSFVDLRYHRAQGIADWKDSMSPRTHTSFLRPLAVIAILILGAYWAGARWGARQPINVGAGPYDTGAGSVKNASFAERDAALTNDEALNVR